MAVLNSNPEVLLRKRKNNERKKLEKQEQARQKKIELQKKRKRAAKAHFIRPETLIARNRATEIEDKRVNHILKYEKQQRAKLSHEDGDNESDNKLLFVIRVPNHTRKLRIPPKIANILTLLRLNSANTGVFVKQTTATLPLLRLISPYVVAGSPSFNSIRKLFQKRACIQVVDEDAEEEEKEGDSVPLKTVKLDNNQAVEDKFGDDLGIICIEDIIHELVSLGDNFKSVNSWILPFKLTEPVSGWGPRSKLAKLQYEKQHQKKITLAGHAPLIEIDIDQFIEEQN